MVILISGTSHVGKTLISQKLLEKLLVPYLSIDHLKMGLFRAGKTKFTPLSLYSDITSEIWPIIEGIIKTNIENDQDIIIEGCFIPKNYSEYFDEEYLKHIKYCCIVMSDEYLEKQSQNLEKYACVIENRIDDEIEIDLIKECNKEFRENCIKRNYHYYLVDKEYNPDWIVDDFINYIGE